jgi:quercetin dioxygenase-like cupin family protein
MLIRSADCPKQLSRHHDQIAKRLLLPNSVVPGLTQVAISTFAPEVETELHSHPTMWEMFFVLEGEATYLSEGNSFEVAPGDLFVIPPGTLHKQVALARPHVVLHWGIAAD